MSLKKTRFIKGIILAPDSVALDGIEGEIKVDSSTGKILVTLKDGVNPSASREIVTSSQSQTLTNKGIDADTNTISNLETENLKSGVLNTSITLSGASDTQLPSALAVKTYIDNVAAGQNEASEISYSNVTSGLTATNVQAAIDEVEGRVDSVETNLSNHLNDTTDAHDASAISVVPTGNLAADDVQEALQELQSDIDTRATSSALTTHTSASSGVHGITGSVVGTSDNQTLTTKTIDADNNTISNLETDNLKAGVLNTSTSLSGASNTQIPSALAVKSYADAIAPAIVAEETSVTLLNNQTNADVTGLNIDAFAAVIIEYYINRVVEDGFSTFYFLQLGQLRLVNHPNIGWMLSDNYAGNNAGIEFRVDNPTGQIQYTSSNIPNTSHTCTFKYRIVKTFGV